VLQAEDLDDASAIAFEALNALANETHAALDYAGTRDKVRADIAGRIRDSVALGAWIEGRLAGIVSYVGGPDDPYAEFGGEDEAGIRMLAVGLRSQGRGVGAALVRACIDRARSDKKRRIVLHTTPWMHAAQRLYPKLGFERAPELDFRPEPNLPLLGYTLLLET